MTYDTQNKKKKEIRPARKTNEKINKNYLAVKTCKQLLTSEQGTTESHRFRQRNFCDRLCL